SQILLPETGFFVTGQCLPLHAATRRGRGAPDRGELNRCRYHCCPHQDRRRHHSEERACEPGGKNSREQRAEPEPCRSCFIRLPGPVPEGEERSEEKCGREDGVSNSRQLPVEFHDDRACG